MAASEGLPPDAQAAVITCSDRAAAEQRPDESGPLASALLTELGFSVGALTVVPDDEGAIANALQSAIDGGVDLVVTTGGTGLAPRDVTPEATRQVLEREAPGLAEALRQHNRDRVPTTILSRSVAGVAGGTLIVNLPGSTGGVRDGIAVLRPVVGHAVAQLRGGDH